MIVTIDGPAGAGKSSAAKALAKRLGFRFLDTGAMYRALTLAAVRQNLDWSQPHLLAELALLVDIELRQDRVFLNGEDVSQEIRASGITSLVFHAAGNAAVREVMVQLQQRAAVGQNIVTEGRDQGTVVFPDAQCKIFLTASPEERARRRLLDLQNRGEFVSFEKVLADQNERDLRDVSRECGPLVPATDAIEFITDGFSQEEVVERLETIVREKCPPHFPLRKRAPAATVSSEISNISEV